jgi:hypothetical protein
VVRHVVIAAVVVDDDFGAFDEIRFNRMVRCHHRRSLKNKRKRLRACAQAGQ